MDGREFTRRETSREEDRQTAREILRRVWLNRGTLTEQESEFLKYRAFTGEVKIVTAIRVGEIGLDLSEVIRALDRQWFPGAPSAADTLIPMIEAALERVEGPRQQAKPERSNRFTEAIRRVY